MARVIDVWVRHDETAAMKFIEGIHTSKLRGRLASTVAHQIKYSEPSKALDIGLDHMLPNATRDRLVQQIFDEWSKQDIPGAMKGLTRLKRDSERGYAVVMVGEAWRKEDPAAAFKWLMNLGWQPRIQSLRSDVFLDWCRADMESARAYFEKEERDENLHGALARALAESSVDECLKWVRSLPEGIAREQAASRAVSTIAESDPAGAAGLLMEVGKRQRYGVLRDVAQRWGKTDFEAAFKWVETLDDVRFRSEAGASLMAQLDKEKMATIAEILFSQKESEVKHNVMRSFAMRWVYWAPEATCEWISKTSDVDLKSSLFHLALSAMTTREPEKAAALLDQYLGSDASPQTVEIVLSAWSKVDGKAAAQWAGKRGGAQMTYAGAQQFLKTKGVKDVAEVESFIAAIKEPGVRNKALAYWVERYSGLDAIGALAWLDDPRFSKDSRVDLRTVIRRGMETNAEETKNKVLAVKETEYRDRLLAHVVAYMSEDLPVKAFEFLLELEDRRIFLNNQFRYTAVKVSRKDPRLAAELAMKVKAPTVRKTTVTDVLRYWSNSDVTAALEFARKTKDQEIKLELMVLVARSLVKTDPLAAVAIANELQGVGQITALRSVLNDWIEKDVGKAVAWIEKEADENLKLRIIESIGYTLASRDPERLARLAAGLPSGRARGNSLGRAIKAWGSKDAQGALSFVLQLESLSEQKDFSALVFSSAVSSFKDQVPLLFFRIKSEEVKLHVFDRIRRDWTRKDSLAAAKWMLENLTKDQRAGMVSELSSYSITGGFEIFDELIRTLPDNKRIRPTQSLTSAWLRKDQKAALEWLKSLENGTTKDAALQSACQSIGFDDVMLASQLAQQIQSETQQAFTFGTIAGQSMKNPEVGLTWLKTITKQTNYFRAVASGMYALGQKDPMKAVSFAVSQSDPGLRSEAIYQLASSWGRLEPEAALNGLLALEDQALRERGVVTVVALWANQDPHGVAKQLDLLKPKSLRDAAIKKFIKEIHYSRPETAAPWLPQIDITSLGMIPVEIGLKLLKTHPERGKDLIETLPESMKRQAISQAKRRKLW